MFNTPSDTCINGKYFCDCCGFNTLDSKWEYDICPICYWVDNFNNYEAPDESYDGPNHQTSLMRARHNHALFGSSHINRNAFVRQPYAHEIHHFFDTFPKFAICVAGKYFCPCVATTPCYKKVNTTIVTSAFGKMTLNKMLTLGDLAVTHIPFFKPV